MCNSDEKLNITSNLTNYTYCAHLVFLWARILDNIYIFTTSDMVIAPE